MLLLLAQILSLGSRFWNMKIVTGQAAAFIVQGGSRQELSGMYCILRLRNWERKSQECISLGILQVCNYWPIADDIMVILNIYIDIHIVRGNCEGVFFNKLSTGTKVELWQAKKTFGLVLCLKRPGREFWSPLDTNWRGGVGCCPACLSEEQSLCSSVLVLSSLWHRLVVVDPPIHIKSAIISSVIYRGPFLGQTPLASSATVKAVWGDRRVTC